jgi:predicted transcriptional regulator
MPKTLNIRVSGASDALDRFEAAWHLATGRTAPAPVAVLSFANLPLLLKSLTPARWALLRALRGAGPQTVFGLARRLQRDYKNVHTDVQALARTGLIEKDAAGKISVPWDGIRADFRL